MLTYTVVGPRADGQFCVVYPTPGCSAQTVAVTCSSQDLADQEAKRLNQKQRVWQRAIDENRRLRGMVVGGRFA